MKIKDIEADKVGSDLVQSASVNFFKQKTNQKIITVFRDEAIHNLSVSQPCHQLVINYRS